MYSLYDKTVGGVGESREQRNLLFKQLHRGICNKEAGEEVTESKRRQRKKNHKIRNKSTKDHG